MGQLYVHRMVRGKHDAATLCPDVLESVTTKGLDKRNRVLMILLLTIENLWNCFPLTTTTVTIRYTEPYDTLNHMIH